MIYYLQKMENKMNKISQKELEAILDAHVLWLKNEKNGVCANLTGANLSGASLFDANLGYANLINANLTGANLTDADLGYADLAGANLTNANLSGASLFDANLTNANLINANLTGANLSGASLFDANLTNANLADANLTNANLTDADLTDANLTQTTTDKRYISISGIGSSKRMTTYCFEEDKIWCGCFTGTLEEFERKVKKTHNTNKQYLDEYIGFIKYIKGLIKEQGK